MKRKIVVLILQTLFIHSSSNGGEANVHVNLGKFTEERISEIISDSLTYGSNDKKIDFISEQFIDIPYKESTLIGDDKTEEILTINFAGLDCFTYIDYVEALRLSDKYSDFRDNLIKVRYKNENVSYSSRNHFFSDWTDNTDRIEDITQNVGGDSVIVASKSLNKKKDGTLYLNELPVVTRQISYIPSAKIDGSVTSKLRTGDYVGIYSDKPGLDVSHTGIIIKKDGSTFLRHASSRSENRRVVDEELLEYIKNKPGIVVYRPY